MSIISNLSLACGGGVIPSAAQVVRGDTSHIFIGLGGTGIDTLHALKQSMIERLKPEDPDSEYPRYKNIRFLAVDSVQENLGNPNRERNAILEEEFFSIDRRETLKEIQDFDFLRTLPEVSWFNHKEIRLLAIQTMGWQTRQIRRYEFFRRRYR